MSRAAFAMGKQSPLTLNTLGTRLAKPLRSLTNLDPFLLLKVKFPTSSSSRTSTATLQMVVTTSSSLLATTMFVRSSRGWGCLHWCRKAARARSCERVQECCTIPHARICHPMSNLSRLRMLAVCFAPPIHLYGRCDAEIRLHRHLQQPSGCK